MSVSTNAILFYGYSWDEERPWRIGRDDDDGDEDDPERDWQARFAAALGVSPPSANASDKVRVAYWKRRRDLLEASPCEVDVHCSNSCPMAYVAVKASVTVAHRGHPKTIESIEIDPTWLAQLQAFCQTLGISTADKLPSWQLVSFWEA